MASPTTPISAAAACSSRASVRLKPVRESPGVRSGFGIFAGGSPDVYISNSFSNTGILTNSIDVRAGNAAGVYTGATNAQGAAILNGVNGATINPTANTVLLNGTVASASTTNALDPSSSCPTSGVRPCRPTIAWIWAVWAEWNLGADLFYSKVRQQVLFTDLRVKPNGLLTPDGRPRYSPVTSFTDTNSDLFLTNTTKGRSYIGVLRADVDWDFGLSAGASFTYQSVKDQAPAPSSTASSNYANGAFSDPNVVQYGTANDEVKYNIKYNLTFDHAFYKDFKTTISLFGETTYQPPVQLHLPGCRSARHGIRDDRHRFALPAVCAERRERSAGFLCQRLRTRPLS